MTEAKQELAPQNGNGHLVMPVSPAMAFVNMVERIARDPSIDIDRLERVMAMRERVMAEEARVAFDAAFADMQPKLPIVDKKGRIEGESKRTGTQISQAYGRWEDISPAITPILAQNGFGIRFRQEQVQRPTGDLATRITCVLSHRLGHREEAYFDLPLDTSGSKNNVQAYGSTAQYGKRYSALLVLNIVTKGEDDDGKAAGNGYITPEQVEKIAQKCAALDSDAVAGFLKHIGAESFETIRADTYDRALFVLGLKLGELKKGASK